MTKETGIGLGVMGAIGAGLLLLSSRETNPPVQVAESTVNPTLTPAEIALQQHNGAIAQQSTGAPQMGSIFCGCGSSTCGCG